MNIYGVSIGFRHGYKSGQVASPGTGKLQILLLFIKKGSKAECNNYRPVSLTNVVCKVMESVIRDHIMKFFLDNDFFQQYAVWVFKGQINCFTVAEHY